MEVQERGKTIPQPLAAPRYPQDLSMTVQALICACDLLYAVFL